MLLNLIIFNLDISNTKSDPKDIMNKFVPLRQFINDRLYHPIGGYFCRTDFQVGQMKTPIDFNSLLGYQDYKDQLIEKYPKNAWLTPSEIFRPYYGMSIARYITEVEEIYRRQNPGNHTIKIVQGGGGTGSAAQSILFYFQNHGQQYFRNIEYHIVEISPVLCGHIQKKLRKTFPRLLQKGQIKIINSDIQKYRNSNRCYTILLEVLDNLAHDKVIKDNEGIFSTYSTVDLETKQQRYDKIENDKVVQECLNLYLKYSKLRDSNKKLQGHRKSILNRMSQLFLQKKQQKRNSKELFLPTCLLQTLQSFKKNIPSANFIISDFDSLVSPLSGQNAPLVSFKGERSAEKQQFETYLIDQGQADIFFPVDFQFLQFLHSQVFQKQAKVLKSENFFEKYSVNSWTQTKNGFNPLRQDFSNTSFLLTKI